MLAVFDRLLDAVYSIAKVSLPSLTSGIVAVLAVHGPGGVRCDVFEESAWGWRSDCLACIRLRFMPYLP